MGQKLIDGNITIEDRASAALSAIEQKLRNIEKIAKPVTNQMRKLNEEIAKFGSGEAARSSLKSPSNIIYRDYGAGGSRAHLSYRNDIRSTRPEIRRIEAEEKRTDWQRRMDRLAAKGGKMQPLWESMGKATSALNLARSPHLLTEGIGGVFGKLGTLGKSLGGFATGRMIGGMFGSKVLGGIVGGAVGGPIGIAISTVGTLIMSGVTKLIAGVRDIKAVLDEMSSERATESTSLRRKMQMSSEMFGVNPRDIAAIDQKIYGLRALEQQYYKKGMSGRDITTSAIDWLHLLGTKDIGGVFADEQQAFDFSAALSSIAKMNGLSEAEYETVRYQGMQILSKGYADILDVKPLLNSAPGFVRDLLNQTGMSRKEFLESGRTHAFTSDKFIDALMGVKKYYEILAERMSSRTAEQQAEAAKNIIGAASVWDELYKKNKAESNQEVANAIIRGGLASDIEESFYQMWSMTNDAQDGVLRKALIEKQITNDILKGLMNTYGVFITLKNGIDIVLDSVFWTVGQIGTMIINSLDLLGQGFLGLFGVLFQKIGDITGSETLSSWGERLNPDSKTRRKERARDDLADKMSEKIYEEYQKHGAKYIENKYGYVLDKAVGKEVSIGGASEDKKVTPFAYTLGGAIYNKLFGNKNEGGYGYSSTTNLMDDLLYENATDKMEERFRDKSVIKKMISDNIDNFIDANGDFASGISTVNAEGTMSMATAAMMSSPETYRSLAEDFGLKHSNVEDYTWTNSMKDRVDWVDRTALNAIKNDINDVKRTWGNILDTDKETNKALEDVKAPYVDKMAAIDRNVEDIKEGQDKSNNQILDILKEIAGVTVINKVTKVRPDVVFNFGDYGRNGKNEMSNLKRLGDKLSSIYDNYDGDGISVNGIPVGESN